MVSEMVDGRVRIDGHNVEIIGVRHISGCVITPQTGLRVHSSLAVLPFSVRVWSGMITI